MSLKDAAKLLVGTSGVAKAYYGASTVWTPPAQSIVQVGSLASDGSGLTADQTIPIPAGAVGDVIVILVTSRAPVISNYTLVQDAATSPLAPHRVFYRVATGSDAPVFNSGTIFRWGAVARRFSGVSKASPVISVSTTATVNAAATTTLSPPSLGALPSSAVVIMDVSIHAAQGTYLAGLVGTPSSAFTDHVMSPINPINNTCTEMGAICKADAIVGSPSYVLTKTSANGSVIASLLSLRAG